MLRYAGPGSLEMLVTLVFPERDQFLPQEVEPTIQAKELLMVASIETGVEESALGFIFDGRPIDLEKTLSDLGIKNGDMIVIAKKTSPTPGVTSSSRPAPTSSSNEAEQLRQFILGDETFQAQLSASNPALLDAALSNSPQFPEMVRQLQAQLGGQSQIEAEKAALYRTLAVDPFNVEAQKRIEEIIKEENIATNMEHAMEFHPESFGQVHMLYINTEINGHPVKTFVDCGAQTTIMMQKCAERCGVTRLIDTRFSGIAKGVGQGKITGRVHSVMVKIGAQHLPCSLTILEGDGPDMLLGLDMLKRHQANINLKKDRLEINDEEIEFLPEHLIPKDN